MVTGGTGSFIAESCLIGFIFFSSVKGELLFACDDAKLNDALMFGLGRGRIGGGREVVS